MRNNRTTTTCAARQYLAQQRLPRDAQAGHVIGIVAQRIKVRDELRFNNSGTVVELRQAINLAERLQPFFGFQNQRHSRDFKQQTLAASPFCLD